ncbi:MAG: protein tyrosine phosphatase family protein [Bacteroidales bacterium]|nr:protein tyrosine phosphatase family protein [Bacteroidales bacterium]
MATTINNYYEYTDKLAAGGQPTLEQLQKLNEAGFEAVINISPVSARNAVHNEHQLVESLNMDYVHFPVDCSRLQEHHYLTVRSLFNSFEGKKVFVHCGGNIKTSNFVHMYSVLEKKMEESESLQTLLKIQQPEAKWFSYFKKMGMKGIELVETQN